MTKEIKHNLPKTTIEKNICIKLMENNAGLNLSELSNFLNEKDFIVAVILTDMKKRNLIQFVNGIYYAQSPIII